MRSLLFGLRLCTVQASYSVPRNATRPVQRLADNNQNTKRMGHLHMKIHRSPVVLAGLSSLLLAGCNLEVETTQGGLVFSDNAQIQCHNNEGQCLVEQYEKVGDGTDHLQFTLNARPDAGYRFAGWEGSCNKADHHRCEVKMKGNLLIKAKFEPIVLAQSAAPASTVRFVALGDTGEGNTTQRFVADAMLNVCKEAGGCQFATGLGDNIYHENPLSTYDTAFEVKFEAPYADLDFPFYMALGNHDNDLLFDGLGGFNHAGDIQVAYTFRPHKASSKWQMPDRYYHYAAPMGDVTPLVDFFALDSNPLVTAVELAPAYEVNIYKQQQSEWFTQTLAASRAPWKIAYAHHPYLSNGRHGNAGNYDGVPALEDITGRVSGKVYRQWLEQTICGKVDVFIAGHDHDLQMLHATPACGKTWFVVSGGGSKVRSFGNAERNASYWQQDNTAGFFLMEVSGNQLKAKAYTVDIYNGETVLAFEQTLHRQQ